MLFTKFFNVYGIIDIANAFRRFIDEETWKYETEIGDAIINSFLNETDAASDPPYVQEFPEVVIVTLKFNICLLLSPGIIVLLWVFTRILLVGPNCFTSYWQIKIFLL